MLTFARLKEIREAANRATFQHAQQLRSDRDHLDHNNPRPVDLTNEELLELCQHTFAWLNEHAGDDEFPNAEWWDE